jgi:hypothetical protein
MNATRDLRSHILILFCLTLFGAVLLLASCASVRAPEDEAKKEPGVLRPVWRAGDRWVYAWTAGISKGTKTSEVTAQQDLGGVQYNVLRMGTADLYYTLELHWAASVVASKVVARATPPQPWFNWPLEVGKRWEYQGAYEDQERKDRVRESYRVIGVEQVVVPVGTFQAFKIVREVNGSIVDEYWYAPDVRWYVKWVGRRGKDEFQEVLQQYGTAPQTGAPGVPPVGERVPPGIETQPRP